MQEERMHEREHMILSFVEDEHYRPMKIKEMAALMNVPKKQRGEFHEVLDRLIAKGKIAINRRGLSDYEEILLLRIYWQPRKDLFCKSGRTERGYFYSGILLQPCLSW